jgi:hypothetical protein
MAGKKRINAIPIFLGVIKDILGLTAHTFHVYHERDSTQNSGFSVNEITIQLTL